MPDPFRSPKVVKLEQQNEALLAQVDKLRNSLQLLVDAKDHKNKHGKDSIYLEKQIEAWFVARQALTKS